MAQANTYTNTNTFARIDGIKIQVKTFLDNTVDFNNEHAKLIEKLIDDQALKVVTVYAYREPDKELHFAYIELSIDWGTYSIYMANGKEKVTLGREYKNNFSRLINQMVIAFNEGVSQKKLLTGWNFRYSDNINIVEANKKYGTSTGKPIRYPDGMKKIYEDKDLKLDEIKVAFFKS